MTRPYYNRISKSGRIKVMNTMIKRKDIVNAIEEVLSLRKRAVATPMPRGGDVGNVITKLPPELRNHIYAFALDMGSPLASAHRVPRSKNTPPNQSSGTGLLRLCKKISIEARSLMEAFEVAYIPIMASMNFTDLITAVLQHGGFCLPPIQNTIFTALCSFMRVHFHLHTNHWPAKDPNDHEPYIDPGTSSIYGRLRQALLIYTCASASVFHGLGQGSIKRKAVVHFDHLFSDWRHMLAMTGCYKIKHLIRIMGADPNTNWDIKYYVHAGGQIKAEQWSEWDERLTRDFRGLTEECSKFSNIKVLAEVYGELTWSLEGQTEEVTRCITPSSTLWPSWPDDVPWRVFERVRSDKAVPLSAE